MRKRCRLRSPKPAAWAALGLRRSRARDADGRVAGHGYRRSAILHATLMLTDAAPGRDRRRRNWDSWPPFALHDAAVAAAPALTVAIGSQMAERPVWRGAKNRRHSDRRRGRPGRGRSRHRVELPPSSGRDRITRDGLCRRGHRRGAAMLFDHLQRPCRRGSLCGTAVQVLR